MNNRNICIITPSKPSISETFIQAHIDLIEGNKFVLFGQYPDLLYENRHLVYFYRSNHFFRKLEKILPFFLYERFIIPVKKNPAVYLEAIENFLRKNQINVILAEYGHTGTHILSIARKLNIKLIVHFHGVDAYQDWYLQNFKTAYQKLFNYAQIVSVSNAMTRQLISIGKPEKKIILNPYGPKNNYFSINPDYNANTFLAVGRFTNKKAPHLTILAFEILQKQFPDAELVMVGDGPLLIACKSLAKSLGIQNKIVFKGAIIQEEIIKIIPQCFCFIQHSVRAEDGDSEGTPVSILEAGASGLPVISTRHGGIMDVVIENETGILVNEFDFIAMANAMETLFTNRKLAMSLGQNAKRNIKNNFNINKHIDVINNILTQSE